MYGGSIIISRTVSESTSTLKLKDAQGRVVLDKKVKEELEKILDYFNIQVVFYVNNFFKWRNLIQFLMHVQYPTDHFENPAYLHLNSIEHKDKS